jgi:hypothetical protein
MAARKKVLDPCPIREQLLSEFKRRHEHYSQTFYALLRTTSVAEASWLVVGLYAECAAAKKTLQQHERKHGCYQLTI